MVQVTRLKTMEYERVYTYPDGKILVFKNIVAVGVSERGTHRLEDMDGYKHLVLPGFLCVSLDTTEWTF